MREALAALTTRGRAFLAAGTATALCAFVLGYDALLRVGVLAAGVPVLTAVIVSKARYRLRADRSITPGRVAVGDTATVTLRLTNEGRMPTGLLLLEDRVPYALGTRPRFVIDHMGRRWTRELSYPVRSEGRGHYEIGPLVVRVSDPFGMIELIRRFTVTTRLVVTPAVHRLPALAATNEWLGTGDRRPRAFTAGSAEDVTVREYRRGDDLRRVHWHSTARTGELMVRREEQHWQSRATILLDGRQVAHVGTGPGSSLEWAVSAAASISVHLARAGFSVRLITEHPDVEAATWHDHTMSPHAQSGPVLDQLAALTPSPQVVLADAAQAVSRRPGLLVAVLGRLRAEDIPELSRALPAGGRGLALLLDGESWRSAAPAQTAAREHAEPAGSGGSHGSVGRTVAQHAALLRAAGWMVVVAVASDAVPQVWQRLGAALHGRGRSEWSGASAVSDRATAEGA